MKLEEILQKQTEPEFEDEKINSNFYLISLPVSLRKLKSMEGSKDYEERLRENEWLKDICPKCTETGAISLDRLKMEISPDARSCDGFLYDAGSGVNGMSILFEMKNVNRSKMIEFIASREKDSIWEKVKDSIALLQREIEFSGGLTGEDLLKRTHLLLIYGGKADTVSEATLGIGKKQAVKRNDKGRQMRAASLSSGFQKKYTSKKSEEDIFRRFHEKLRKKGLASCEKGFFGIPAKDPKWEKQNGRKLLGFTMLSKEDLCQVIEEVGFFEHWNWGNYRTYFQ